MTTRRGFVAGLALGGLGGAAGMGIVASRDGGSGSRGEDPWTDEAEPGDPEPEGPPDPPEGLAAAVRPEVLEVRDGVYGGTEPELRLDEELSGAAGYLARHMAREGEVTRDGPGGKSLAQVYSKFGLVERAEANGVLELIERGEWNAGSAEIGSRSASGLASALVSSWDRDVLVRRRWSAHGIGLAAKDGVVYGAQNFL